MAGLQSLSRRGRLRWATRSSGRTSSKGPRAASVLRLALPPSNTFWVLDLYWRSFGVCVPSCSTCIAIEDRDRNLRRGRMQYIGTMLGGFWWSVESQWTEDDEVPPPPEVIPTEPRGASALGSLARFAKIRITPDALALQRKRQVGGFRWVSCLIFAIVALLGFANWAMVRLLRHRTDDQARNDTGNVDWRSEEPIFPGARGRSSGAIPSTEVIHRCASGSMRPQTVSWTWAWTPMGDRTVDGVGMRRIVTGCRSVLLGTSRVYPSQVRGADGYLGSRPANRLVCRVPVESDTGRVWAAFVLDNLADLARLRLGGRSCIRRDRSGGGILHQHRRPLFRCWTVRRLSLRISVAVRKWRTMVCAGRPA